MRKLDAAYINGKIYTVDEGFSIVQAFGVSDGRFACVGTNEEVLEAGFVIDEDSPESILDVFDSSSGDGDSDEPYEE